MKKYLKLLALMVATVVCANAYGQVANELQFNDKTLNDHNKVEIFPNPSTNYLNVEISNSKMKKPVLEIYSIIGNVVKVEQHIISTNKFRLNVSNIPAGYYLLSIRDEHSQYKETFKFLKR